MLIAEISNIHFGSTERAEELIRIAKESGADAVKGQAFMAKDFKTGSMPREFYETCAFTFDEYIALIEYGKMIQIPVFFSILSEEYAGLTDYQKYNKITAGQWDNQAWPFLWKDEPGTFISTSTPTVYAKLKHVQILYATPYLCEECDFTNIETLRNFYKRDVGLSDHAVSIEPVMVAIHNYGVNLIEKHFTLKKHLAWSDGTVYRDSIHGATPKDLEKIAKALGG